MMAHASKSSSWPSAVAERRFCVQAASCSGGSRAFLNALYQQLFLPESRIIGDVAYCTDTNFIPEETFERLAGLDILVLDCLRPTRHSTHFSLEESLAVGSSTSTSSAQSVGGPRAGDTGGGSSCSLQRGGTAMVGRDHGEGPDQVSIDRGH